MSDTTPLKSPDREALAAWERDGGRVPPTEFDDRARRDEPYLPSYGPGYQVQAAWGFHDPTGGFFCELNRVYGPPADLDTRGPIALLREDLCYWTVSWTSLGDGGQERQEGWCVSFAQARKLRGPGLSFTQFSSSQPLILQMGRPES
jgi:hypothetical protein